jgi:23S rRNA (cytidine1920-2'-O)/16S rRNA (cytidine1409-2'-O)-methyltransferase
VEENIKNKGRIDLLLVKKGLAPTRARARSLIMAGVVYVDGTKLEKAGTIVRENSTIQVKHPALRYVSRGGVKLEAALREFEIDVRDKDALDIGASTGGFTDCLLQFGVRRVYAVDVGYGQLDWKLRQDPRVVVMERVNARYLNPEDIGKLVDISTVDVSFISVTKVTPPVSKILKTGGVLIVLIKPQFEVGKGKVGKGGIVKEEEKHREVISKIISFLEGLNFRILGVIPSPILGADGNKEFLAVAVLL